MMQNTLSIPVQGSGVAAGGAGTPAENPDFEARAADAAALLKALAHRDRLLLLCRLVEGELSVSELGALAGLGQPSLSQQLGVLRAEGLVAMRADGKRRLYRIASPAALALLQTLHGLFCEPDPAPSPKEHP